MLQNSENNIEMFNDRMKSISHGIYVWLSLIVDAIGESKAVRWIYPYSSLKGHVSLWPVSIPARWGFCAP